MLTSSFWAKGQTSERSWQAPSFPQLCHRLTGKAAGAVVGSSAVPCSNLWLQSYSEGLGSCLQSGWIKNESHYLSLSPQTSSSSLCLLASQERSVALDGEPTPPWEAMILSSQSWGTGTTPEHVMHISKARAQRKPANGFGQFKCYSQTKHHGIGHHHPQPW